MYIYIYICICVYEYVYIYINMHAFSFVGETGPVCFFAEHRLEPVLLLVVLVVPGQQHPCNVHVK